MRRKRQPRWIVIAQEMYMQLFPPLAQREFIRAVNQWWLRLKGFRSNVMVGPYRMDFVSDRIKQIIQIERTPKKAQDIVAQQEAQTRETNRDRFLYKRGYTMLYVRDIDIFSNPEEVRLMVREWSKDPVKYYDSLQK